MQTLGEFWRWLGERHDGMVCCDTESSGLSPYKDRLRMIQLGDKRHGWAFGPQWFGPALEALDKWPGRLGMFNMDYDQRVIHHQGGLQLDFSRLDDAQLISHLVDSAAPLDLKTRASRDVDPTAAAWERELKEAMKAQKWTWATVPDSLPEYWRYGAADPVLTSWLIDKHWGEARQYINVYDMELRYAAICASMMNAGMRIDRPYIHEWIDKITAFTERAMFWLRGEWGINSVDSNEQVGRALEAAGVPILYRTGTGMPQVSKDVLLEYQAHYPHAAPLLAAIRDAKKGQGIVGKYLEKFLRMAGADDVIHYSIHTIGAQRTSRSSVTDPPMHQFDRIVEAVRGSYVPGEDEALITIDADQIEMRLAAHISGDAQLIADFAMCDATGRSFFVNLASEIYREEVAKSDPRYPTTKNTAYATVYGSGMETAAVTAGVSVEQLEPIYRGFKQRYHTLAMRSNKLVKKIKYGKGRPAVYSLMGRRLFVDRGREYAGIDYEIQSSAAENLKRGAIACDAAGIGEFLRLPVHDELLLACPKHLARDVLHAAQEVLTDRSNYRLPLTWSGEILPGRWVKT